MDNLEPVVENQDPEVKETEVKETPVTTSWLDSIEDVELKAVPALKNFKSVTDLAKSYVNQSHVIGMDKIHLPKDPEDKIGWQMFYEKLGVPKDVEGYTLPTEIEGIEKDRLEAIRDEKMEGAFKEWAKEANLLPRQAEILYKNFIKMTASQQGELDSFKDEQRNEAEKKLRTEWGKAYQVNIELAKNVMRKFAGEEVMGLLEDGFGNDPNVIRMFAEIGKNLSESIIKGKPSGMVMTPEQAEAELKKLIADTKSPLYDPAHIEHDIYVQKKANLAAMAYPEPEKGG